MASKRDLGEELSSRWDREASSLEQQARNDPACTAIEKRMLDMHARVKRGCAIELRLESRKVTRG